MSKIIDLRTATRVPPATGQEPAFETTLAETLAIRKFIEMSLADIKGQLERAAKDGTPRRVFAQQKASAVIITAWLTSALMMVDGMLAEAAARTNTTLANQIETAGHDNPVA